MAVLVFVCFSLFYLAGSGGFILTPDGTLMFRAAEAMAFRGRLDTAPIEGMEDFGGKWVRHPDGQRRFYVKYGPGLSLAAVPFLWVGKALLPLATAQDARLFARPGAIFEFRRPEGDPLLVTARGLYYPVDEAHFPVAWLAFCATWVNALTTAGTVTGLFSTARVVGFSARTSLLLAAVSGLGSPLWAYSKEFFAEPLGALAVSWFLYFLALASVRGLHKAWWWAGAVLGAATLAKPAHAVLVPAALVPLGWLAWHLPRRRGLAVAVLFSLGFVVAASPSLVYNWARFKSPWQTGYAEEAFIWDTPLAEGIRGLLVSPGRGLFVYAPLAFLGVLAMPRFLRRSPELGAFGFLAALILVLFYGRWYMWEGGWCWGPRFLVPILPCLFLPAAELLQSPPRMALPRLALACALALGLAIAFSGVMVGYHEYARWLSFEFKVNASSYRAEGYADYYELMRWSWAHSPLVQYWLFPVKDYFLFPHAFSYPGLVLGLFLLWSGGLVVSGVFLLRAVRSES